LDVSHPTPTVIDTTPLFVGGTASWLRYAPVHSDDQDSFFMAWTDFRAPLVGYDVYGAYVAWRMPGQMALQAPRFGPRDGFLISRSAHRESSPAISKCGNQYLVVYSYQNDLDIQETDIRGTILDSTGSVVKTLTIGSGHDRQDNPAVACDPTNLNWEVIWEESDHNAQIYGNRVSSTGDLLFDHVGIFLYGTITPSLHPAIAYGAGTFWAVWEQDNGSEILAIHINPATGIADLNPVVIAGPSSSCGLTGVFTPDIDFDGTNFFVAYVADGFGCDTVQGEITRSIDVTPLSPSGMLGDPSGVDGIFGSVAAPPVATVSNPRIKFNGTDYVVAYEDNRASSGANFDITAAVFDPSFATFSYTSVATSSDDETRPRVAVRDSSGDVEVTYIRTPVGQLFDHNVWGQSITGNALNGAAFPIASRVGVEETMPAIDCGQPTTCVAPFREFDPADMTTGVDRIKARVLGY
jgi:hypothetical protein